MKNLLLSAIACICSAQAAIAVPSAVGDPGVYTGGHADIGVSYISGRLEFRYDLAASAIIDGSPLGLDTHAAPSEIITQAGPAAYQEVSGAISSVFPGTHGYFFGGEPSTTSPYLGIGADDPSLLAESWVLAPGLPFAFMNYQITGVTYTGAAANPQVLYYAFDQSGENLYTHYNHVDPNSATHPIITMPIFNAHGHPNWAFSDPGVYDINFSASATHATNGLLEAIGTYRFEIIGVPEPTSLMLLASSCITLVRRQRS